MGSNVLPQITECGEVLAAAFRFTVKCFPCVKPLMCFQPIKYPREIPFVIMYYKASPHQLNRLQDQVHKPRANNETKVTLFIAKQIVNTNLTIYIYICWK